jgi:hypothetical protein
MPGCARDLVLAGDGAASRDRSARARARVSLRRGSVVVSWDPQGGGAAHRRDFTALYDAERNRGANPLEAFKAASDTMARRGNQLRTSGAEDVSQKLVGIEVVVRRFLREKLEGAKPRTSAGFSTRDVRQWLEKHALRHVGEASFTRIMRKLNKDFAAHRPVYVETVSQPKGLYRVYKA